MLDGGVWGNEFMQLLENPLLTDTLAKLECRIEGEEEEEDGAWRHGSKFPAQGSR